MYTKISAKQAKQIMNSEPGIIILDVRTEEEYMQGHIADSRLIPLDEFSKTIEKQVPNKDAKILVYCSSGNRSEKASQILEQKGYTSVFNFGGILNWPYEIV